MKFSWILFFLIGLFYISLSEVRAVQFPNRRNPKDIFKILSGAYPEYDGYNYYQTTQSPYSLTYYYNNNGIGVYGQWINGQFYYYYNGQYYASGAYTTAAYNYGK